MSSLISSFPSLGRLPSLLSQLYNLFLAPVCVSEQPDTKSASYSIMHADKRQEHTQTGQLQDGLHLYLISSLLQPLPVLIPPSFCLPKPVSTGEADISLLRGGWEAYRSLLSSHFGLKRP